MNWLCRAARWMWERLRSASARLVEDLIVLLVGAAIGAGTVWLYSGGASTKGTAVTLPPGVSPYVFVSQNFRDAEREMKGKTSVVFEPRGLAKLRLCGDTLDIEDRPRGRAYLDLILERLDGCLDLEVHEKPEGEPTKITLRANPSSRRYKGTYRFLGPGNGTEDLHFCGCERETIELLEQNAMFP